MLVGNSELLNIFFFFHLFHWRGYFPVKIRNWNLRQEIKLLKTKKHTGGFILTSSCCLPEKNHVPGPRRNLQMWLHTTANVSEGRHQELWIRSMVFHLSKERREGRFCLNIKLKIDAWWNFRKSSRNRWQMNTWQKSRFFLKS